MGKGVVNIKLILVRHGKTFANEKNIYQGWGDAALNNTGIEQAESVSKLLKDYYITNTYCSTKTRCIQTLDYIKNKNKTINSVEYLEDLRETHFGLWEDKNVETIEKEFKKEWEEFLNNHNEFTFPEGESYKGFYNRCIKALKYIIDKSNSEDIILIVAHAGVVRCIISYLMGLEEKGFYYITPKQGAYSLINIYDNPRCIDIEYINKDS